MREETLYWWILGGVLAIGLVTFPALFFFTAPYGRFAAKSRLPTIDSTLGWVLMETPSALGMLACFFLGDRRDPARMALLALWELHYLNRTYVFPFRRRGGRARRMPVHVFLAALVFTSFNSYLNGRWLFTLSPASAYGASWLADPRFLAGAALFLAGWGINLQSDEILFNLRKPGESGYKIPRGGLYRFISCPNYFGEILEWCGFAIAAWSPPALVFAIWTIANLVPRAVAHHRWYRETFSDYPPERRAIIPYLL
jgi:protein-S-isoprenylcysteine O-methyltransferase Ste14